MSAWVPLLHRMATANGAVSYVFECPACHELHAYGTGYTLTGTVAKPTIRPVLRVDSRGVGGELCVSVLSRGTLTFTGECTHGMAGLSVPLEPW